LQLIQLVFHFAKYQSPIVRASLNESGPFPRSAEIRSQGHVPDKVTSPPSLGRESVRLSSILHDEFKSRAAAAG
jgi:hypothetical protein